MTNDPESYWCEDTGAQSRGTNDRARCLTCDWETVEVSNRERKHAAERHTAETGHTRYALDHVLTTVVEADDE